MSSVMLAKRYEPEKHDVLGWNMSEKLDGLRSIWTGEKCFSRNKNELAIPIEFLADFPKDMALDGEMFCGAGNFNTASSLVKRKTAPTYQEFLDGNVMYNVFDAPLLGGTFEERMAILRPLLKDKKHIVLCDQTTVTSLDQMNAYMQTVVKRKPVGGEGIMLRNPNSTYETKRSSQLLKVKEMHDAEAIVIAHLPGKGSNKNVTGSMLCEMIPSGQQFKCGSGMTDADRKNPPPIGRTITCKSTSAIVVVVIVVVVVAVYFLIV
jgi:DNA ligase-1